MMYGLELLGAAAFAASGVIASRARRPDILGAMILAFATALGGGAVRDAILGVPAQTFGDDGYFAAILAGAIAALALPRAMAAFGQPLRVFDALGLAVFNASGMIKAHESGEVTPCSR